MAPKVDKKPAENKLVEEKKTTVAEKAHRKQDKIVVDRRAAEIELDARQRSRLTAMVFAEKAHINDNNLHGPVPRPLAGMSSLKVFSQNAANAFLMLCVIYLVLLEMFQITNYMLL
ncbi:leucine-rich repeat receptor-like protein kinase family protein [Striga asiatica]|uniref:Leucine-rich repeat receptor-like protein kinase family protein n=1 Tax=Striga asiatica TaxID=4170 RepID=A0A5A7PXQ0_STRAF|nr:leucine-rich repeat receptor-like protein kinase family protein [Striga asiatica]